MIKPELRVIDLRTEVPSDWTLTGLSAPRSDGANFFRTPVASQSILRFSTPATRFIEYRYQLFSQTQAVSGRVSLNGQVLDTFTFPAGKFVNREVTGFTEAGANTLTVEYRCGSGSCQAVPVQQYWTQVKLVVPARPRTDVGLGVERWVLDAPGSPLTVRGTGPLRFDNENHFRFVQGQELTLAWPPGTRVIDASFQVSADGPFRVTTSVAGQVISRKRGDKATSVTPTFNLVKYPAAGSLQVQIDCLTGAPDCARLYFARASVIPPEVNTSGGPFPVTVTILLALVGLVGLARWLRLLPPASRRPT